MRLWIFRFLQVIAVFLVFHVFFGESGPRQAYHLRLASKHIQILEPKLKADSRFDDISLYPFTGQGGCLRVSGQLKTIEDKNELYRLIMSSSPPVKVCFLLTVNDKIFSGIIEKDGKIVKESKMPSVSRIL